MGADTTCAKRCRQEGYTPSAEGCTRPAGTRTPSPWIAKRYPNGILTGQTALYAHGLVTAPPDRIDLATKRGGTKIRDAAVRQHFIPEEWLGVGRSTVSMDGIELAAYDLERMLLELMRSRNKLPYDLYREAVASFRRRSERLDIYRLQDYADVIPRGGAYLERAMEEVF